MSLERSLFIVPADTQRAIDKARTSGADAVILDLEDTVEPEDKQLALDNTLSVLPQWNSDDPTPYVRVNGLDSRWGIGNIETLLNSSTRPNGFVIPDIRARSEIDIMGNIITELESVVDLIPILERPEAIFNAREIAQADYVEGLAFGAVDFRMNMGMSILDQTGDVTLPKYIVSMAANAEDIKAIDTVYLDRDNIEGLRVETEAAKAMGFDGKIGLTIDQIDPINAVFTPTADEIERAQSVIDEFQAADGGVIYYDGIFIDKPVVDEQRKLIETGKAAGVAK